MPRNFELLILGILALLMSGCGASITNRQVKVDGKEIPDPQGIRYRGVMPFEIRVVTVKGDNSSPTVRHHEAQILFLPDPRQLYEINYTGALFRSYSFTTTFRENSTLENVSLEALQEPQGAAAASAIGEIIRSSRESEEARKRANPEKDRLQKDFEVLDLRLKIKELEEKLGGK